MIGNLPEGFIEVEVEVANDGPKAGAEVVDLILEFFLCFPVF